MSRQPPKKSLRMLERAIQLRAQGVTWAEVGKRLGKDPSYCRSWPSRYREFWATRLADARAEHHDEITDETWATLRRQMRAEDPKPVQEATRMLVTLGSRRRPAAAAAIDVNLLAAPPPDPVEGLSDAEFRDYLLALLADEAESDDGAAVDPAPVAEQVH